MAEPNEPEEAVQEAQPHDPFTLKILATVQLHRSLNGLRHNDHLRPKRESRIKGALKVYIVLYSLTLL